VTAQDVDDATVLRGGLIGARRRALKLTTAVVERSKIASGATTVVAHHEHGDHRPQDTSGPGHGLAQEIPGVADAEQWQHPAPDIGQRSKAWIRAERPAD
jgi:hypothetical protein